MEIFVSDLCRPVRFDFEEEVVVDGIVGYKYGIGKNALDNGKEWFLGSTFNLCICDKLKRLHL